LSHRPEPSVHALDYAVHGEVDGLDIGGRHGRRFVLLRHTTLTGRRGGHTPFVQAGAAVKLDPARLFLVLGRVVLGTAFEHREKEAPACLMHKSIIAVV